MRTVAIPIRISDSGQLERAAAGDSLLQLIRVMGATTAGTWPHAPWFGLQEKFVTANLGLEDQQGLVDAINRAFDELGIEWARVKSIKTSPESRSVSRESMTGERRFNISLALDGDQLAHGEVSV